MAEESKISGKSRGLANLKPFVPGKSGNPAGKKRGQLDYATIYKMALIKIGKANGKTSDELEADLLAMGFGKARGGDYRFYKDVIDRIHGTPIQKVESQVNMTGVVNVRDPETQKLAEEYEKKLREKL